MNPLWAILPLAWVNSTHANPALWQDIQARNTTETANVTPLQHYRLLALDEAQLPAQATLPTLSLPLPDGGFAQVTATPSEVLAPDIAAQHPDIQTWKVRGTDGKVISGVLDITPQGFHAMLDMANGDTLFIDPHTNGTTRQYRSFRKSANLEAFRRGDWSCTKTAHSTPPSFAPIRPTGTAARTVAAKAGETLHSYRIAMAATGEYTAFYGSQSAAYSAIVTTINRINQIYERDLAIRLVLVSGTNLVYRDATTDPYSNHNPALLLEENTAVLDKVLGNASYDIGHVLATDGGGLASVATVCGAYKAEGATGLTEPEGESFIVDYVSHEIGHQLGATHTFNGTLGACSGSNRERLTAYESGSGSSIMAYTGLCNSDNLQVDSDGMMHSASIQQIQDYLHNGSGASCAAKTSLKNSNPTANAGANYTIPAGTPFVLNGTGADVNGNTLSYSWEQVDAGTAANVNVDLGNNALIRAHLPTATPLRTIPQLSDLTGRVQSAGEVLPVTTRTLNFRLLVRDGVGGTGYDDMHINVQNTGSAFSVTAPTTTALAAGSVQNVAWNVAGTTQLPINCSAVDIAATTDNGATFTTLLSNTPNDGNAAITLPSNLGTKTYVRVKCSDNIFFALSATNPAQARTANGGSANLTVTPNTFSSDSSSSGGGGSIPLEWGLLAGVYALFRLRKGAAS
ncbi:reprolysin-like metallopeptidase [Thiothrix fructosivorans]|uniref:Peptidase M12B domain-containing protein n=1 Tax=Thiothrix fructosivorans TaxID=111770 RepID=A0A8B0SH46_9GAMM|nr:zinc-dependent metalloprotease family protein [Thiothrix fructosivorans]MBO0613114.1 hypothetical protein [Thiothrix fructosivorans]QTX11443.1 hypothetical protein J1836_003555 [Thiothrix fructosivorans]